MWHRKFDAKCLEMQRLTLADDMRGGAAVNAHVDDSDSRVGQSPVDVLNSPSWSLFWPWSGQTIAISPRIFLIPWEILLRHVFKSESLDGKLDQVLLVYWRFKDGFFYSTKPQMVSEPVNK